MTTSTKLAAFFVGALAAFGAAFGLGRVVGPIGGAGDPGHPTHPTVTTTTHPTGPHDGHEGEGAGS